MGRKKAIKFASLKMLCDVVVAQESEFQKCPLVREFDTFADCIADHRVPSSTVLLQSGSTGIVTVSVPDCRKSVERSTVPNAEMGLQTPPDNLFPDNGKKKFDCASSKLSTVDNCCTDVGEGNFGNGFNETKKIRVSEGSWNELSKRIRISENLNLGRPTEESLLKKSLASDHLDLQCKSVNEYSLKPKPTFMKIKGGEDSNCSVFIDLESEEFDEKTGRESLGVDSHVKICTESSGAAYKGEPQKIATCRGGGKDSKLQIDGLCKIGENKKLGKISESEIVKINKGEKAYKNINGKGGLEVEMIIYEPSAADIGRKAKARGRVGGSGGERHDLQPSLKGIKKKAKEREVAWNLETENGFLVDFSKVLIGDVDSDGKGVDFLETAKRRGWTFPRPRWWPPEGFEG